MQRKNIENLEKVDQEHTAIAQDKFKENEDRVKEIKSKVKSLDKEIDDEDKIVNDFYVDRPVLNLKFPYINNTLQR